MVDEIGNDVQRRYWKVKPRAEGEEEQQERQMAVYDSDSSDEEMAEEEEDGNNGVEDVRKELDGVKLDQESNGAIEAKAESLTDGKADGAKAVDKEDPMLEPKR